MCLHGIEPLNDAGRFSAAGGLGAIDEGLGAISEAAESAAMSPRSNAHAGIYRVLDLCVARESSELSSPKTVDLQKGSMITVTGAARTPPGGGQLVRRTLFHSAGISVQARALPVPPFLFPRPSSFWLSIVCAATR